MFGENGCLRAENAELRKQLDDPYVQLGLQIGADIANTLESGGGDKQITAIIDARREQASTAAVAAAAEIKAAELISLEKEKITAFADVEAHYLARNALQHFLETEGETFRAATKRRLTVDHSVQLIAEARQLIAAEAREEAVSEVAERLRSEQQAAAEARIKRSQFKGRAQRMRAMSKRAHLIEFSEFEPSDIVTVGFANVGAGYSNLTDGFGSYMSHLEERRLSFKVLEPADGTVEIYQDSWLDNPDHRNRALRAGLVVNVRSSEKDQSAPFRPVLVKGRPITLDGVEGHQITYREHEVWWADLDEFRAMS